MGVRGWGGGVVGLMGGGVGEEAGVRGGGGEGTGEWGLVFWKGEGVCGLGVRGGRWGGRNAGGV